MGTQGSNDEKRSWRKIEALREKKRLRDDLADIWDDDWDLDEAEILGNDDSVKIYADSEEDEVEAVLEVASDDGSDDFDDDEIYDDED